MARKLMIMRWVIYNTDGCYEIDDNEMQIDDNEMLMLSDELELCFCFVQSRLVHNPKSKVATTNKFAHVVNSTNLIGCRKTAGCPFSQAI